MQWAQTRIFRVLTITAWVIFPPKKEVEFIAAQTVCLDGEIKCTVQHAKKWHQKEVLQLIRIRKVTYPAKAYVFPLASGSLIALIIAFATSTTCEKKILIITDRKQECMHTLLFQKWFTGEKRKKTNQTTHLHTKDLGLSYQKLTYTGCFTVFLPREIRGTPPNQRMSDGKTHM